MAPFDRWHTSSYSPSIVTMAISCIVARYSDLLVENREIFIPHLYLAPRRGWPRRNFVKMFDDDKNRMIGLPYGENLWRYVKPFSSDTGTSRIYTDRRMDGQTDLLYQYRALGLTNVPLSLIYPNAVTRAVSANSWACLFLRLSCPHSTVTVLSTGDCLRPDVDVTRYVVIHWRLCVSHVTNDDGGFRGEV